LGEHGGVPSLLPVNPSQCPFVQMTDTDVAFLLYYRPCPYDRHDLYLHSIPASLQNLGRFECAVASARAPHGLRMSEDSVRTQQSSHPYLSFLRAFWMDLTGRTTAHVMRRRSCAARNPHHAPLRVDPKSGKLSYKDQLERNFQVEIRPHSDLWPPPPISTWGDRGGSENNWRLLLRASYRLRERSERVCE